MAVLEQTISKSAENAALTKGKPEADPFADVRDGGKCSLTKFDNEKANAMLEAKKIIPDDFGIDGLEDGGKCPISKPGKKVIKDGGPKGNDGANESHSSDGGKPELQSVKPELLYVKPKC